MEVNPWFHLVYFTITLLWTSQGYKFGSSLTYKKYVRLWWNRTIWTLYWSLIYQNGYKNYLRSQAHLGPSISFPRTCSISKTPLFQDKSIYLPPSTKTGLYIFELCTSKMNLNTTLNNVFSVVQYFMLLWQLFFSDTCYR